MARCKQPFTATDDYGVVAGQATITLDLAGVDRRYGLAADPEAARPDRARPADADAPATGQSSPRR